MAARRVSGRRVWAIEGRGFEWSMRVVRRRGGRGPGWRAVVVLSSSPLAAVSGDVGGWVVSRSYAEGVVPGSLCSRCTCGW